MKSDVLLVGQSTPKHKVFIFDAYGKLFKVLNLEEIVKNVNSMTVWTLFAFNSDEDLVLLTRDGRLFLIDIVLGEVRDESMF
jgi:hypothetical protein